MFNKARQVSKQGIEEKILKKSKQKTFISDLIDWYILFNSRKFTLQRIKEKIFKKNKQKTYFIDLISF